MNRQEMVEGLRAEIARLQQVVDLLLDQPKAPEPRRSPGRPKKAVEAAVSPESEVSAPGTRRQMSPEGKARIAAAQRKRWADQKAGSSAGPVKASKKTALGKAAKKVGRPAKAESTTVKTPAKKTSAKKRANQVSAAKGAATKQTRKQATKSIEAPDNQ